MRFQVLTVGLLGILATALPIANETTDTISLDVLAIVEERGYSYRRVY